jgi:hypothetical protein
LLVGLILVSSADRYSLRRLFWGCPPLPSEQGGEIRWILWREGYLRGRALGFCARIIPWQAAANEIESLFLEFLRYDAGIKRYFHLLWERLPFLLLLRNASTSPRAAGEVNAFK